MTEGFVFYPSYWKAMERMPMEQRGVFISAMSLYWETGEEPALEYPLDVAWELVKPNLDAHKQRKEQGAKGGKKSKKAKDTDEISILTEKNKGTYTDEISILKNSNKGTYTNTVTEEEVEVEEDKRDIKDILPTKSAALPIYKDVIEYLNAKLGTHYKADNKKTQSLIAARLKEGHKLDDFKTVIDKKADEWRGTEFEQYLKPDTLFSNKFEGYLNQTIRGKPKKSNANFNQRDDDFDAIAMQIIANQSGLGG